MTMALVADDDDDQDRSEDPIAKNEGEWEEESNQVNFYQNILIALLMNKVDRFICSII